MDISWEDAETFLAVAEQRSFSAAARHLGLGQPTISRRIALLEERVGAQLFLRGKRGAELTAEGERLLPASKQMARWAGEFRRAARGAETEVSGVVRLAAPPAFALDLLGPFAGRVRQRLPEIRLEVLSSIEHVELSRGVADLAVRTRAPGEPELTSIQSIAISLGVYSSPGYAARIPQPCELASLDWVTWAFPFEHVAPRPMLERVIPEFVPAFASDSYLVQRRAVEAGVGAMILERPIHVASGGQGLVEIDVGIDLPPAQLHLVCARSMRYVPRVRAVVGLLQEFLSEGLARD